MVLAAIAHAQGHSDTTYLTGAAVSAAVGILLLIGSLIVQSKLGNESVTVIAVKRSERKRISERSRRDIIVATVAAVVGAVVIGAAGLWAGLLVK